MSKKYYLIREDKSFYDGHGCPDDGGSIIRVEHTDEFKDLDLSKLYSEDLEVLEDDFDEDFSAEDGYNDEVTTLSISEISKENYFKYSDIINNYNTLLNSL